MSEENFTDEDFTKSLDTVVMGIVERSRAEQRAEKPWATLWESSEQGLERLLSSAEQQMSEVVLNLSDVIETKFGIKCSRKLYNLLKALPFAFSAVRNTIEKEQSHVCCADKTRKVYYEEVLAEINAIKASKQ